MRIDIAKAFNLAADDQEGWKKALIFTAIYIACIFGSILILPAFFLMLYAPGIIVQYVRNVASGDNNQEVPQPTNMGGLWHGFMMLLIGVVYSLPGMGVMAIGFGGALIAIIKGADSNSALASMGGLAGLGVVGFVMCLLFFVIALVMPMVMLQYTRRYQFGDAFNFSAIMSGMMRSPLDYAAVVFIPFAANMLIAFIPFGNLIGGPIMMLIGGNLIGQYGAKVLDMYEGSAPSAPTPDVGFSKF